MRAIDEVSADAINAAIEIRRELGPGLFESVYEAVLAANLQRSGYPVDRQMPVDIEYDGMQFRQRFEWTGSSMSGWPSRSNPSSNAIPRMPNNC